MIESIGFQLEVSLMENDANYMEERLYSLSFTIICRGILVECKSKKGVIDFEN